MLITAAALGLAYAVGFPAGLVAGLRRAVDGWVMRPVDVLVVVPWFLLLAVLATVAGRGAPALVAAGALTALPWVVKVVRGATVEEASAGYVEAAEARAEPLWRVAVHEVAPNVAPVVVADAGMRLTATLSVVTAGGYLGLGLPPNTPDWALEIAANQGGLTVQPWAVLGPASMIVLLVVSVNLVADSSPVRRAAQRPARPAGPRVTGGPDALVAELLTVHDEDGNELLRGVDLAVGPGRGLAVVGSSGSGKSTLVRAVVGALAPGLRTGGRVRMSAVPGRRTVGWVPQDPALGLSAGMRIGTQIRDVLRAHGQPVTRATVSATLRGVGLPDDPTFARRYPYQLSGGQQQRVMVALALIGDPGLLVLDEPTTGLDPGAAERIVDLIRQRRTRGTALLIVTHDLEPVRHLVDDVLTVDDGRACRRPPTALEMRPVAGNTNRPGLPLLRARGLAAAYGRQPVLDGVDLDIGVGECLGLIGNSGAGKSTVARCLVGLHRPLSGTISLAGEALAPHASGRTPAQRGAIQYVFQNPARSLNPRRTVAEELAAPIRTFGTAVTPGDLLDRVGLSTGLLHRRTDQLSGGQQQRVALARALGTGPTLLICDEIVSSLDPANRRAILDLLRTQLDAGGPAVLFISHDREAVDTLTDSVLVMTGGRPVSGVSPEGSADARESFISVSDCTTDDPVGADRFGAAPPTGLPRSPSDARCRG
nr:ATP-binding cassette domain-containing protein [Pseudonocardia sp. C8]